MNIIVLGGGAFGTAIANELSVNTENNVVLFSRSQQKVDEINNCNTNKSCFPNKHLTKLLSATSDRNQLKNTDVILIALPSPVIIENLNALKSYFNEEALFVNLSKGLFSEGVTVVESIEKRLGIKNIVTLKGPSFSVEVMEHADTLLTLGYSTSKQYGIINTIIKNTSLFRIPHPSTKSAFDKNLNANANSMKPKETFNFFNQSPDLGINDKYLG